MGQLLQRLKDAARSGVYRASRIDPLADALRGSGLDFARVEVKGISGKQALMKVLGASLSLPGWFGENWDALEDCLTDLSWRGGEGHVIAFEACGTLPREDLVVLIQVLEAAADFWRSRGKPFFAVFVDPACELALPDLFNEA